MYPSIAICGALRAGKDEVAKYLCEKYGYTRFAFGDELKRFAYEIFGAPLDGNKPRDLLQWFGQAMRHRDPDVWVRKCFDAIEDSRRIMGHYGVTEKAVITDLRQPNEYDRCRAEGYAIIRVNAPEGVRINRAVESADTFKLAELRHETELHVDSFAVDYEVNNAGTLAELHTQIDAIMTEVSADGVAR